MRHMRSNCATSINDGTRDQLGCIGQWVAKNKLSGRWENFRDVTLGHLSHSAASCFCTLESNLVVQKVSIFWDWPISPGYGLYKNVLALRAPILEFGNSDRTSTSKSEARLTPTKPTRHLASPSSTMPALFCLSLSNSLFVNLFASNLKSAR
jgi:hypothetical protein